MQIHAIVLERLRSTRKRQQTVTLLNGALVCLFFASLLIVNAILLERAFSLGSTGRMFLLFTSLLGIAGAASWFVGRPLLRMFGLFSSGTLYDVALTVGRRFPDIRDRLLNALQLVDSKKVPPHLYSEELVDAAFADLYRDVQAVDFLEAIDSSGLKRMRRFAVYACTALVLTVLLSPSGFFGSAYRIFNFNRSFAAPLPLHLAVDPGNVEVIRGTTVGLSVKVIGKAVSRITMHTRQQGQAEFELHEVSRAVGTGMDAAFRDSIPSIKSTTEYFAEAEDVRSESFTIKVVNRPLIRSLRVQLKYPAYTRLPLKLQDENVGDVSAYRGTTVSLAVTSSKELDSASVVFSDTSTLPMAIGGVSAHGYFRVDRDKSYHVVLFDDEHLASADPVEYQINVMPDVSPTIDLVVPGRNVDLAESMQLALLIRVSDDFGFSGLRLAYRLAQSRYERPAEEFSFIAIPLPATDLVKQEIQYRWNLAGMSLVPDDVVAYYAEVFDNDNVSGPKPARTQTYLVRFPSLDEIFRDVAESQSQSLETLQSASRDLQQMKKSMDELRNEMKVHEKSDWQRQKKAEELKKRLEDLRQKLDETAQQLDENIRKMQENNLLSRETLEKYLELQKLMEELKSPELAQALQRLQEAMKHVSPDQIRAALQRLQLAEELLRKSLERTIELLKRIAIEQKLDELVKRTESLLGQQEDLRKRVTQADASDQKRLDELAARQTDLQKQLEALQKELADLRKRMENFPSEMPLKEVEQAQQELDTQQLGSHMQDAGEQVRSGKMQQAQGSQKKISEGLRQFMERMRSAQKSLRENQQRQVAREMQRFLQDVIELSRRQEGLKEETRNLDPSSQRFRDAAQRQKEELDDLSNLANNLLQLSRKTFAISPEMGREIGKAMQQMVQALQSMEQRNPGMTSQAQGEAMGALNNAGVMMRNALDAMMQGGGGSGMAGFMERLRQMTGMQMGINAQSQSLMGQGQGMTPQQAAEWSRLAGEQGAVRKSLEELARESESAGETSRILGDLNRIAEEMREVQTDMEQGAVNPETEKKQEHILSRLLDSQRSMRERDYEKRRRAEVGKTIARPGPGELDLTTQEGRNRLRQELLKILELGFSRDYEELIRRYFETLEREEIRQ